MKGESSPPPAASVSERARALLAAEYSDDPTLAEKIRAGTSRNGDVPRALRAIEQALTQQRGDDQVMLPAGWYAFVHDCAQMRGMEVNGNRLSMKAADLLAAATTPQPSADAVRKVIGSMRNFADVADKCELTEGNAQVAIRAWASQLESLLSGGSHA